MSWLPNPKKRDEASRITRSQDEGDRINEAYAKEIAQFEIEHQTRRQDWGDAQWRRFQLWRGTGGSVTDAARLWHQRTHEQYGRFLLLSKRISDG